MKKTVLLALLLSAASANATITLQTFFGALHDASGAVVPEGTLWALVVDNGAAGFAGGFGANSSLAQAGAAEVFAPGQSLSIGGLLGSDTIWAMGGVSADAGAAGSAAPVFTSMAYGTNGLAAGLNYAIYWFPGVTYSGSGSQTIGSQVGGFHSTAGNTDLGVSGMTLPPDGNTDTQGFVTVSAGGQIDDATVRAVIIPEASTALLGLLGAIGLIRRRR